MSANVNEVDAKKRSKKVHKRVNRKNVTAASMVLVSTLAMILPSSAAAQVSEYKRTLADESVVRRSIKKTHKNLLEPLSPVSSDLSKRTANRLAAEAMKSINNSVAGAGVDGVDGSNGAGAGVAGSNGATGVAGDNAGAGTDSGAVDGSGDASSDTNPAVGAPAGVNTAGVNGQDNQKTAKPDTTAQQPKTETAAKGTVATKPESTNPEATAQSSDSSKAKQPEVKPSVETPAENQPVQPETSQTASAKPAAKTEKENADPTDAKPTDAKSTEVKPESTPTAKQDAKQPSETKQPEENAGGVKPAEVNPAENQQPANAQSGNAESAKPATSNTDSENTNPANEHTVTTTTSAPAAPANNVPETPSAAPAGNVSAPSASTSSAGAESNAGAGTTANPTAEKPSTQGNAAAQGSQSSAEGTNTGVQGANKNGAPSTAGSTPTSEPRSTSNNDPTPSPASTQNAGTQGAGTQNTGTTNTGSATNNTATDPNSQVIKPNTDNPEAGSTSEANGQVQTDKKPKATYNLKIRYTIGGAANKQLVQPYELTIDEGFLNNLGKDGKYEYIELPKAAGYRPSVYHSGDYQYYVKKVEGANSKFVIDDGTDADAIRYLRLSKKLITDYAVKKRQAVESNNSVQTSQNTSSTQSGSDDGIQYYGELNINYAPKTAKYYVRHLLQKLDNKDEFEEAPNIGKPIVVEHKTTNDDGSVTTTKEVIHVTEITGTVGSDVTAVSTYIPGYEPEHNLISSPLSDSEDEKDKLVLNLRYYRKAYEVTYDSAGGTDVTAQKVYYGQEVPEVTEPTYRGHTFLGWQIVEPGESANRSSTSNRSVTNEALNYKMPDHNVQFRAAWSANEATSYRVNVWVQKADLVDKEHPDSLVNYDFVGLVERKNVQTDSEVALDKMNDAGVVDDASKLNGASETEYVKNPELGLTKEELQGKDSKHETGLIAKFNWMNDTHVTNLEGYDTTNPGAESNYLKDSSGNYVTGPIDAKTPNWDNRVYKDIFTRYFHVNKDLTKKLNNEQHDFVPGRPDLGKRSKAKLCANDLNNTLNLVYDRNTYELIFAKPAGVDNGDNAAIKRKDENGKTTIYCYAGGGGCSDKYVGKDKDEHGTEINHKGYRVNVRYGQKLTDIWPDVNELYFSEEGKGSLGWQLGFAGVVKYRDTPPYRFTKEEFADPRWRAAFKKNPKDKVIPKISDDPEHNPQVTHELKDNQRLLTADKSNQSQPIQVIIRKQSIASAKKGGDISEDDYELSTDSYSKDDTPSGDYDYPAPSIAGFNPADGYDTARVGDALDSDDFEGKLEEWYNESHDHGEWDDLSEDEQKAFAKKYHLAFRKYRGVPVDEQEGYTGDATEFDDNKPLEFRYDRQKYAVQFYNADGNAITKDNVAATEELPFEYSLTKRGNAKLTGEDADLYYDGGNVKSYDASVTKDDADDTSKQFDGKYTFTLNGTKYSIVRPENLPKDYVFKGWAVDQAGIHLINGKINDNSEGTEGEGKAKGKAKDFTMPVNGIKLYAAWGKPTDIKHTVTLNYHMPEIDENGNEIKDSNVVTKQQFDHYYVIKENKDIKVPTRKGYDFYGWEIDKNGTKLPYAFGNKVVEDITLDAVWVKDTRYNGTFKHIFLKPGYTFTDYKQPGLSESAKAAMVDHISTQTVSGLREHLRYNAEAVYSDETHFPDKQFTSFEASKDEDQNTGEFIYQTYNTRKYKVKYIDQDGKDLLPESEVSSVNRKYDVAFYKPIEGFMPETTQQNIEYAIGKDGKQIGEKTYTFKYKDVRVLKRQDDAQSRPTNYTRYVFKVADGQGSMGSVVDWQGSNVADGSALVYDAIKGTKAYQMPLPTVKAKPGYEFDVWTSKIYIDDGHGGQTHTDGFDRLPILSESQPNPKVIYTVKFKLKAPVAIDTKVLKPTDALSLDDNSAKELIKNADKYPSNAKFSFAPGERFDSTPGLHKIKVQVHLDGNTAAAEVLYRVLPDLVYASDWGKFKATEYGSKHADDYVPITFTGKNDEGTIIGHDGGNTGSSTSGITTLTAYVYKNKDVRIRVPQAFGKDYNGQHYHYVFKGWVTKVVEPTTSTPSASTPSSGTMKPDEQKPEEKKQEQTFDINSSDRYKNVNLDNGVTYHAIYKRIDYFSSSSDNGTVPKDSVIAIFKPAPKRKWKDGSDGPKVFYVKKGANLADITVKVTDSDGNTTEEKALDFLQNNLTNPTGKWSRSKMINGKEEVTPIDNVSDWKVDKPFQEFVADQTPWTKPKVQTDYLVAVQGKSELPALEKYLTKESFDALKEAKKKGEIEDVKFDYDLPKGKTPEEFENEMLSKPSLYTVPLKVTVNYKDGAKPEPYNLVARLKVIYQLMYPESLPKDDTKPAPKHDIKKNYDTPVIGESGEINLVTNNTDKYVKVEFENPNSTEGTVSGRKEYYILNASKETNTTGIKAPQATGKKYDERSFHYEFVGWKMVKGSIASTTPTVKPVASTSSSAAPALPMVALYASAPNTTGAGVIRSVETGNSSKDNIYTKEQIAKMSFTENTKFEAVFRKVDNVLKPGTNEKIPDNYVPHLFLPGFGRRWTDGTSNPKVFYFDPESSNYYNDINNKVDNLGVQLKGFGGWSIYGAAGNELNASSPDYTKKETRVYVAKQARINDVNASDIVLSVGDGIPGPDELVHGNDAKSNPNIVGVQGAGVYDINNAITKPGITTVVVNVTRTNDKKEQVIVPVKVHIRVLPKVIADKDLPEKGTKEYGFIAQNYTKVMYAAGEGGTMQSPMHTYWVRNGKEYAIRDYIPDVLADKGYVFKDWSSKTIEKPAAPADQRKATNEEREVLANIAIVDGVSYVAKIIRNSHNSTLAALQNLLSEAQKEHAKEIYKAKKEQLAKIAESNGKHYLAELIRKSNNSTLAALSNLLAQNITNPLEINNTIERDKLAELADAAGKSFVANIIRNSKKSSLEALKQLLRSVGVNPETSLPEPQPTYETTITANFEKMAPMKFKLSGSAREGIFTNFRLQNMTEGNLNADGTPDTKNTKITVDGKEVTINDLVPQVKNSVSGINANCAGTACTISGTPKVVNGQTKVELKFTTTDKYGREAEITMEIDVIPEYTPSPSPTPEPEPEQRTPAPVPAPEIPFVPDFAPSVIPEAQVMEPEVEQPEQPEPEEPQQEPESKPVLAKTGSDTSSVASAGILSAAIAAIGLAVVKTGKHHRKRRNNK
ncbi:InlB B-repeat-containing protein [Gardnerella sp. KA00255]|uniref:InlB B-repeat-containing protein n=1 Tax=Gardnerella sp. KA00255 TaxID=2749073 RepID=UPI003BA8BDA3